MEENKKYLDRIARRILLRTGGITVLFCAAVLITFGIGIYHITSDKTLAADDMIRLLLVILLVICVGTLFSLISLYFISRKVAKESIRPLTEALEREKTFTAYASHELRTPLAVIKGSLEVLIRRPRTEEEYRRKITENIRVVDQMNSMVDNMLTLTRVESGKKQLIAEDCHVKDLFTEACGAYADPLVRRGITVSIDVIPDSLTVRSDRAAMLAILSNGVSNAVKYCNDNGFVNMRAHREKGCVVLEIENTGRGIAKEEAEHVFEPFYRSIATGCQKVKGYGLGLAIVRRMTELIKARVSLISAPEGPTILQIRVPQK